MIDDQNAMKQTSKKDEVNDMIISKGLLKRLYNELKRLKTAENNHLNQLESLSSKYEKYNFVELVGEPMFQENQNELIRRGFKEKLALQNNE